MKKIVIRSQVSGVSLKPKTWNLKPKSDGTFRDSE